MTGWTGCFLGAFLECWARVGEVSVGVSLAEGSFEVLALREGAYLARPQGGGLTSFPERLAREGRWVYHNPQHDAPRRLDYHLRGGALTITVSGGLPRQRLTLRPTSPSADDLLRLDNALGGHPVLAGHSPFDDTGFTLGLDAQGRPCTTLWRDGRPERYPLPEAR
jgi:hypothetical protein